MSTGYLAIVLDGPPGADSRTVLFAARSKILPNFLEGWAESLGRRQRAETRHRIVSLLDSPGDLARIARG